VTTIHEGPVNSEVIMVLPGGKSICAMVTHDSIARLNLTVGSEVCAVFKASSVILCAQN
jgi:molybdate transport system regulatory protein